MPKEIRDLADRNYALLKADPTHSSLRFKKVGSLWSVRVGLHYRALATEADGDVLWFWIGSHGEYDKLVGRKPANKALQPASRAQEKSKSKRRRRGSRLSADALDGRYTFCGDGMGFYIRKGISVGPLRFNLSKSGVGVSAGFRGFRVGAGPRGNYVHMGRHGLYYRATLPGTSPSAEAMPSAAPTPLDTGRLTEIESGSVTAMRDSSSSELLAELDNKRKATRLFPLTVVIAAVILIAAATANRPVVLAAVIGLVGVGLWLTWSRDQLAKTTVLLYDLEPDAQERYQQLHDALDAIAQCKGTWHVEAEGAVEDRKRHAGASSVVRRKPVRLAKGEPPFVRTNVRVPSIPVGRQTLWLFPDRVLVFEPAAVGAVPYLDLRIRRATTRFVEDGNVTCPGSSAQ